MKTKNDLVEELMRSAFGDLMDWGAPAVGKCVGPAFPEIARAFETQVSEVKRQFIEHFSKYSQVGLVREFGQRQGEPLCWEANEIDVHFDITTQIQKLRKSEPAWFISGWNVKAVAFELSYWRGFNECTAEELTLLSIGLDPRKVGFDTLFDGYGHLEQQDDMLLFLEEQHTAIIGGFRLGNKAGDELISWNDFYRWTNHAGLPIDRRFRKLLRDRFGSSPVSSSSCRAQQDEPKAIHRSSYDFHATILFAVAMEKFDLKSPKDIGKATAAICNCAELSGATASLAPVRKLLHRGYELHRESAPVA